MSGAKELSATELDEAKKGTSAILYYMPWCGHCQQMKPAWNEAAKTLASTNPALKLYMINCEKFAAVPATENVEVYPTVRFYGRISPFYEYKGERDAASLVKAIKDFYAKEAAGPSTAEAPVKVEAPASSESSKALVAEESEEHPVLVIDDDESKMAGESHKYNRRVMRLLRKYPHLAEFVELTTFAELGEPIGTYTPPLLIYPDNTVYGGESTFEILKKMAIESL